MTNINKYWIIMETLNFPIIGAPKESGLNEKQRVAANLRILKDNIKISPEEIFKNMVINIENIQQLQHTQNEIVDHNDECFLYCLYSLEMLLEIYKNVNFFSEAKEDLVSERHKLLVISSIADISSIALQGNLYKSFYNQKGSLFKKRVESEMNLLRLQFMLEMISPLIHVKALHVGKSLNDVQLWYMAAIFSLLVAYDSKDICLKTSDISNLHIKLQKLWLELSKKIYYRNLMLLYSSLPNAERKRIYREMLLRLWLPGGFVALLFAMADSQCSEEQSLDEIVANLVSQPSFSIKAQHSLITQIFEFLKTSLNNTDSSVFMGAAILSLRKLYSNKTENREYIKCWFEKEMEPLIRVEMNKVVALEWSDFVDLVSLLFQIFCTSSVATLPSDLLVPYLSVLLQLYNQLECHTNQNIPKSHLRSLILKILNNRSFEELKQVIEYVTLKSYPKEWFQLSRNIQIKENALNMTELKLSVVDVELFPLHMSDKYPLATVVSILKGSSYNLLIYQHFIILLQLVPYLIADTNSSPTCNSNIDLLETEDDINNKILTDFSEIYQTKLQIIKALECLVQHQPLKALIIDNIKDLLKALQDILSAYTTTLDKDICHTELNSASVMILLILIKEIIENCSINLDDLQTHLLKPLKNLETHTQNEHVKYQINCLLNLISGNKLYTRRDCDSAESDFEEARTLIESNTSYLQVEGIEKMIKLLNKRDEFCVANIHTLTALALNTLKSPESYTFLNCVRLFVALVNVHESEVLHLLSDEYLNEDAGKDYRLVIGEAILRTSIELGPLCYKHKHVLLNTYMSGCRSPLDEFRFSAFSNLSHMCRQLTYQVHNYFQELLNLIDCELTTGKYLPAKRAAVMVLSDLLAGMDNLFDYEDMLLPIYRLLKHLVLENNDEKIRIHASNGLETLSEKCKELFKTSLKQHQQNKPLEKEIKVLGISDLSRKNLKTHILEINK